MLGRNLEKDAIEMAAKNQRILENGFRIFTEKSFEKVKMTDVSDAAEIAISSLYRYYSSKPKLIIAISTWVWEEYMKESVKKKRNRKDVGRTAAEEFDAFLESFLDLYRNHKDILRFNQFFNVYLQSEVIPEEEKKPYLDMIRALEARFGETYRKGQQDGTLRTDLPEKKLFSVTIHLMLAAVTRYAVGLVYNEGTDAEEELRLQKEMLLERFCVSR